MAFGAVGMRGGTPGAGQGASSRELGALAFAALALGLLAVAGLASSSSPWHASRGVSSAPAAVLQSLAVVGAVLLVVALLLLWVETPAALRKQRKRRAPQGDELDELGASLWAAGGTAAVLLLGLAVFCIATVPLLTRASPPPQSTPAANPSAPAGSAGSEVGRPARSVSLGWLLLPLALTVVILAPAAAVIRRRRLKQGEATEAAETSALSRAVRASIAALEAERDPRTAILRAYARMEQSFRDVEIVRARDETASEFLERTMRRLTVSADAATALTGRFEEVRFSTHRITEADREQALASLRQVERELGEGS